MKKILLSLVLLLGGVSFANAQTRLTLTSGWNTALGVSGDAVFNYTNAYGEVYAEISEFSLADYPSFEIVLSDDSPVDKLQMKVTTDTGDGYSGAINATTFNNAYTFAPAGSTKVNHLGLQATNVANLGKVEIKEWNLIDKNGNKIPVTYLMDGWAGTITSPANVIKFTTGEIYNFANIVGAEEKYFPKFRFTISADELASNLVMKIMTTNHNTDGTAYYFGITPDGNSDSFDLEMEDGDKITSMLVMIGETAPPFTLTNVVATIQEVTPVEVGEYGWATFVSSKALDFTGSDVKAYAVTGHSGTTVTKSEALTKVPANTPLLLNAAQGSYSIPVIESASAIGTNLLIAGTGSAVSAESGKTKYVLSDASGKAEFLKINTTSATVPEGKAYLVFNETIEARSLNFDDDGTTAIKNMKVGTEDNIYYDLQGRRVLYPTKGLYIVNGKKIIIK